ncbi:MAG: T9SS type A sorting domain-containing protein [Bacteroidia bacterium]
MNNTMLVLLVFLLSSSMLKAQNYQPFDPAQEVYYSLPISPSLGTASLHALVARDLNPNNPDVYYGYKLPRQVESLIGACYQFDGTSWMGDSVWVVSDSLTVFYNEQGLAVNIRPLTQLNETWLLYEETDSFFVTAEVIAWDSENVLGVPDSVKTIEFQVFALDSSVLSQHPLHLSQWQLSQHHGFVSMPAFGQLGHDDKIYTLTDHTYLTRRDIFDWAVGDEHQIENGAAYYFYRVLSKNWSTNQDTLFYEIEESLQVPSENPPLYQKDTNAVFYTDLDTRIDDRVPGEVLVVGEDDPMQSIDDYAFRIREDGRLEMLYHRPLHWEDSCYRDRVVGTVLTETYIQGITMLSIEHAEMGGMSDPQLIYYKRGNDIFGEATAITPDLSPPDDFTLGPNPADQSFSFSWEISPFAESSVRLLDIHGRTLSPPILDERLGVRRSLTVDSRQLPTGIYFLQILGPHGLYSHQILIQH